MFSSTSGALCRWISMASVDTDPIFPAPGCSSQRPLQELSSNDMVKNEKCIRGLESRLSTLRCSARLTWDAVGTILRKTRKAAKWSNFTCHVWWANWEAKIGKLACGMLDLNISAISRRFWGLFPGRWCVAGQHHESRHCHSQARRCHARRCTRSITLPSVWD